MTFLFYRLCPARLLEDKCGQLAAKTAFFGALHHGGADACELQEHGIYVQRAGASTPQLYPTLNGRADSSYLRGQLYTECAGDLQYCIEPRFGAWRKRFV